jgi:hypothetical protein
MSPYKPKHGTYEIDRVLPTVGRLRIRTGTHDKQLATRYEAMLDALPLDAVKLIRDRKLTLRQAYDAWSTGRAHTLPSLQAARPLRETMERWAESPPMPVSGSTYDQRIRTLEMFDRLAQINDVADLLRGLRVTLGTRGATFNRTRAAVMAFVRDDLGRHHPIYAAVAAVEPLPEPQMHDRHPCTVQEAKDIRDRLGAKWGPVWWALCCHGMGPREYWVDGWTVNGLTLEIHGHKRAARERVVPLVVVPPAPVGRPAGFAEALERAELGVTPYDARRSYARWLDELRLPNYQHDALMGHGPKDMRSLYSSGDITAWLADLGDQLRTKLGEDVQLRVAR